jgi:hypothetical protein
MFGRAGLVALFATAACRASPDQPVFEPPTQSPPVSQCAAQRDPPVANIGPDVTLRTACGGSAVGAVASIDEPGAGFVPWTASITGDPEIGLRGGPEMSFVTSSASGPIVAFVVFTAPRDAKPGDSFNAVVTVSSTCADFAPGTVKVHAEVGTPLVIVAPEAVDFGDVTLGTGARQMLMFRNEDTALVSVGVSVATPPFQYDGLAQALLRPGTTGTAFVSVFASTPGDFSTLALWETSPVIDGGLIDGGLPAGCAGTISVPVHAHVVGGDAGADADVDADAD